MADEQSTLAVPTSSRRQSILKRGGDKDSKLSRKPSWVASLNKKFSSSQSQSQPQPTLQPAPPPQNQTPTPTQAPAGRSESVALPRDSSWNGANGSTTPSRKLSLGNPTLGNNNEMDASGKPKESSKFFSNLGRRLSAGQINTPLQPKVVPKYICERMVLNIDPNRARCRVPDMDESKLRRVAFCVDVEIAGGPRYEEDVDDEERKRKTKGAKLKEKAEGAALKAAQAISPEDDAEHDSKSHDDSKTQDLSKENSLEDKLRNKDAQGDANMRPLGSADDIAGDEKKKRTDADRKERREQRRRRAVEKGSIPLEIPLDEDALAIDDDDTTASSPSEQGNSRKSSTSVTAHLEAAQKRRHFTVNPARVYRRCCQLRETPILKRITEQLMAPNACVPRESGIVNCLDLTGSRLHLVDMATLGDWLAIVPVRKLVLDDADLDDEGLRCILAGLLSATHPEPMRRKSTTPKHRKGIQVKPRQERSGVVERLVLKNNPLISGRGWKYISLFLYMCRSIKAIDFSMIPFPETLPPPEANPDITMELTHTTSTTSTNSGESKESMNAADIFFKCIAERPHSNQLEELKFSECRMNAAQITKIVDLSIKCGISVLGLAGNTLGEESLDKVLSYLSSGVCGFVDIGGNDLRGAMGRIAKAMNSKERNPCWGLGLAGCNLDAASLKELFPALRKVPKFRYLDLSHNQDLCSQGDRAIHILRKNMAQMKDFKRIHLADVGMNPKQAIAIAALLAEDSHMSHISIIENPELTALANAHDDAGREEACAFYASYMAAARESKSLVYVDIDVPSEDNSEMVKALAKQIVAYTLRNMERVALSEADEMLSELGGGAPTAITSEGEKLTDDLVVPDILAHLVGRVDDAQTPTSPDTSHPDADYIVGSTGVVKALQYVLGDNNDFRRGSVPSPSEAVSNPMDRPDSSQSHEGGLQKGKAKKLAVSLLWSARRIRGRIQTAMVKQADTDDEMVTKKLAYLDQTLRHIIEQFEEEYPETRIIASSEATSGEISPGLPKSHDRHKTGSEDDDDSSPVRSPSGRSDNSVSRASRALSLEEGNILRIGQEVRRKIVDSSSKEHLPAENADATGAAPTLAEEQQTHERLLSLEKKFDAMSGDELKTLVENGGWDSAMRNIGVNMEMLHDLQKQDPESWAKFEESQMKARLNSFSAASDRE